MAFVSKNIRRVCKACGKEIAKYSKGMCDNCYHKRYYLQFSFLGKHCQANIEGASKGEARKAVPGIINQVLQDCIDNPKKYLEE